MANKKEDWTLLKELFEKMHFKIEEGVLVKYLVDFGNPAWLPNEIKVPDKVTSIAENAFWDAYTLKKVHLPAGLVSIQKNAFANCGKLKEIVFAGTPTQWRLVNKHPYAFSSSVKVTCLAKDKTSDGFFDVAPTPTPSKSTVESKTQKAKPTTSTTNTPQKATESKSNKPNPDDYFIDLDKIDENNW